jgi:hypothetical protein
MSNQNYFTLSIGDIILFTIGKLIYYIVCVSFPEFWSLTQLYYINSGSKFQGILELKLIQLGKYVTLCAGKACLKSFTINPLSTRCFKLTRTKCLTEIIVTLPFQLNFLQ